MEDEGFVNLISGSGNVINFKKGQLNFFFSTPLLGKSLDIARYIDGVPTTQLPIYI